MDKKDIQILNKKLLAWTSRVMKSLDREINKLSNFCADDLYVEKFEAKSILTEIKYLQARLNNFSLLLKEGK